MTRFEKAFMKRFLPEIDDLYAATPSMALRAYHSGQLKIDLRVGPEYEFYDLASLTKVIFTASSVGRSMAKGSIKPKDFVATLWPEFKHKATRVEQLLTHSANMPWWLPYYKSLHGPRTPGLRWAQLEKKLKNIKKVPGKKSVYSDPDLLILGAALMRAEEKNLSSLWQELVDLGCMGRMHFNLKKLRYAKEKYAPTENCKWRKRLLRGEVHDENAFALGGIAPHAGLFGGVDDVAEWALALRKNLLGNSQRLMPQTWLNRLCQRQVNKDRGDWGWLFMKPTAGNASCGKYFSAKSFGHTGFTGTSVWFDPSKDWIVLILSNRVHPTRDNRAFVEWRPKLHNWIIESAKG